MNPQRWATILKHTRDTKSFEFLLILNKNLSIDPSIPILQMTVSKYRSSQNNESILLLVISCLYLMLDNDKMTISNF
jgi:hypothetical protein